MTWLRRRLSGDRGSGSVAAVLFGLLFITLAAFVIDGGLSIHQRERAADIAEQAARFAAGHIDVDALRSGGAVAVDTAACTDNVRTFARRSGLSDADVAQSYCEPVGTNAVTAHIALTYTPAMINMFYTDSLTVHGKATAEAVVQ
ncbi:TadE/TadG family type IV pilus assembly protein [Kitasatospora sp. KL5]|uniref:TadE/TadG family type IV pilus assembly protein n=1 Tax=Kitasatospora sp. KL5 TaxID=3425125 RepID=UPI003D6F1123